MIDIIDFTNCELSNRNLEYAGRAGEKRGIIYNNELWFLKFPKNTIGMNRVTGLSYVTSPLSEYIGSNIYRILEYDVHDTLLGICNDGKRYKVVCACKDFITNDKNELLIPYTALRNDTNPLVMNRNDDSLMSPSNINEIEFQLKNNTILSKISNAKNRFWDVVLIDLLINNNDRNEDNWGIIKFKKENEYKLSPIYDCGNCFYGKSSDEKIKAIMSDSERLNSSAINGITAYEDDNGERITNINILKYVKKYNPESIDRVTKLIEEKFDSIVNFIKDIPNSFNGVELISDVRKEYYIKTMEIRFNRIIK